jgi:uncharacterized lipoprotein YbaY
MAEKAKPTVLETAAAMKITTKTANQHGTVADKIAGALADEARCQIALANIAPRTTADAAGRTLRRSRKDVTADIVIFPLDTNLRTASRPALDLDARRNGRRHR